MKKRNMKPKKKRRIIFTAIFAILLAGVVFGACALSDFLEHERYPLKYEEHITAYAKQYDMDPFLVAAVIYVESGFDPSAVSGKGAVGLMQIMPDTGNWLYERLELDGFDPTVLNKPELNIRLGCYYLNYLYKRYGGNQTNYLAAYNAGLGRVDEWLDNPSYSQDGKILSTIPFKQTEDYVKKVARAYEKYQKLYPDRLQNEN